MAVGDVYELDVHYHVYQRGLTANLWYEEVTEPSPAESGAQDLADAFDGNGHVLMLRSLMSGDSIIDMVKTYKRVLTGGGEGQGVPGQLIYTSIGGERPGDAHLGTSALIVNWVQSQESAKANGRIFLSGILEADTDGNVITNAYRDTAVAGFISAWEPTLTGGITGPNGGVFRQVTMSKLLALSPFDSPVYGTALPITAVSVSPIMRTQRRRASRWESVNPVV